MASMREPRQRNSLLRQAREERGLSQSKVAEAIGVDVRTYRRWENEGLSPSGYPQLQLMKYFGKTTADELGFAERVPRTSLPSHSVQQAAQEEADQECGPLSESSPEPEDLSVQASLASSSSPVMAHQEQKQENDPEIFHDQQAPLVLIEREQPVPTPFPSLQKKHFPYLICLITLIILILGVGSGFLFVLGLSHFTRKPSATTA